MRRPAIALAVILPVTTAVARDGDLGMGHGAQPMPEGRSHSGQADVEFAVRSFGAYRAMMQSRDYAPKPHLTDVEASGATVAVEALSGLRGEITMSERPMAIQNVIEQSSIEGEVVGCHAPPRLAGVITHPGKPFHCHWLDQDRSATAHIDGFGMATDPALFLPRPERSSHRGQGATT